MNNILYKFETSGNVGIFTLNGELHAEHEDELTMLLMKALHGIERAVVNLKKVTRISNTCLQLFNKAYHTSVRLRNPLIFTEVPQKYLSDLFTQTPGRRVIHPQGRDHKTVYKKTGSDKGLFMGVRNLAEAVILQSIEDLWDPAHHKKAIDFFTGDAFNLCSEIAGLDSSGKTKLILFLKGNAHD